MAHNVSVLDLPQGPVRLERTELRDLHRLARERRPHPDSELRRRAVAWARRPVPSAGRLTAVVVTGTLGAAALSAGVYYQAPRLIVLFGLPLTLIAAAVAAGPLRASLIHRVNLSALLDTLSAPAQPLEVGSASVGPRWPRYLPVIVVLVVDAVAAIVAGAYEVTLFCLIAAVLGFIWGRRPVGLVTLPLRLDETGLSLSGSKLELPWTRVAAVELASSVDPYWLGIVWRLQDPSLIPPGLQQRLPDAGRGLVLWLDPRDHPPESIVLTSRAYLAAPPAGDGAAGR
jgi:hypothetical protein